MNRRNFLAQLCVVGSVGLVAGRNITQSDALFEYPPGRNLESYWPGPAIYLGKSATPLLLGDDVLFDADGIAHKSDKMTRAYYWSNDAGEKLFMFPGRMEPNS
jgi:hypothetical protein